MSPDNAVAALVSTEWLAQRLDDPTIRIVDASWYLPAMGRDARAEYLAGHVPGAVYLDVETVSDQTIPLPHMLPSDSQFASAVGALGIGDGHTVVVYDASGVNLSAPRVWWMFRAYGHHAVTVLDGGLGRWRAEGRPLESGERRHPPASLSARLDRSRIRSLDEVQRRPASVQMLDARASERFEGRVAEPRPGVRSGHIPDSLNLPFTELVDRDGRVRALDELRRLLTGAGVDLARPVITSCGSGVTACALLHALELVGHADHALYDGSWTEWGAADTPIEAGPARRTA
jgi:thiosulfate/3-mercaptopyruvate sulfurtransferase